MKNKILVITSLIGASTIILGAFGAHALKDILSNDLLKSFETAVKYQLFHVLLLLIINTTDTLTLLQKKRISYLFFSGILFFSGSIYAITLLSIPAKSIWFVTPLGGLLLILGWIFLAVSFMKSKN